MIILGGLMTGGLLYSGVRVRRLVTKNRIARLKQKKSPNGGPRMGTRAISTTRLPRQPWD